MLSRSPRLDFATNGSALPVGLGGPSLVEYPPRFGLGVRLDDVGEYWFVLGDSEGPSVSTVEIRNVGGVIGAPGAAAASFCGVDGRESASLVMIVGSGGVILALVRWV